MKKVFFSIVFIFSLAILLTAGIALATTIGTSVSTVNVTGTGDLAITGNSTLTGALGVTGATTLSGALTATSSSVTVNNSGATALTVTQSSTGDIINFKDGASEIFTILDGGKVGVGTSTPLSYLSVSTLAQAAPTTKLFTVASTTGAILFSIQGSGATTLNGALTVSGAVTLSSTLNVTSNLTIDTNTIFVNATTDKVGIGTTSPAVQLHVENATAAATTTARFGRSGDAKGTCLQMYNTSGTAYKVFINAAGALTQVAGTCE